MQRHKRRVMLKRFGERGRQMLRRDKDHAVHAPVAKLKNTWLVAHPLLDGKNRGVLPTLGGGL